MTAFRNKVLLATFVTVLTGCGGSDINISPVTQAAPAAATPTPVASPTPNACAAYVDADSQSIQGAVDGIDCRYPSTFTSAGNNLKFDLSLAELAGGGVHIFEGSLFVGETQDTDAKLATASLVQGGDGPTLTIEPGATLAFTSNADFLIVNRGSQILAAGTALKPITLTSLSDIQSLRAATPTLAFDAVQQWGGMVINGFGITNKCSYTGTVAANDLATTDCHVDAEGAAGLDESQYGGDNNNDNSGRLEYVRVKYTGAQVANGDELNGISFGGVGRGTIVNHLQVYSTFDDGIEMFGGAVNISNFVALYVRDDSIDIDEGYSGTIQNALVIQSQTDGNQCIESDGIGSFSGFAATQIEAIITQGVNSRPTINNLTCITSANSAATATHDPGTGWRFREGIFATVNDSLMISAFSADDPATTNSCLRIENRSSQAAQDGDLTLNSVIFSCVDKTNGGTLPNGTTTEAFAIASGSQFATTVTDDNVTATANTALVLLEGTPSIYSVDYATMVVDGLAPTASAPTSGSFIGALSLSQPDWTSGWTFGIHAGARAVDATGADLPLWFE
jgi:hypothetical protein